MSVANERLEALESKARRIREALPEDHDPVVVEFAGSPKAGKSTTIDILAHFFKRTGFKVWAPTEGASKRTPYHLKRDLVAFNTWTLSYAISELLVAYFNVDHHSLIILDRGPYDSLAWMGVLRQREQLGNAEFNVLKNFAVNARWARLVSRLYLFKCDVQTSLARENESKLTHHPGTAMNKDMLSTLLTEYESLEGVVVPPERLKVVTTSNKTTPLQTSLELAEDIVALFDGLTPTTHSGPPSSCKQS